MSLNLKNSHKKKECLRLNHESQEEDKKMKISATKKNKNKTKTVWTSERPKLQDKNPEVK